MAAGALAYDHLNDAIQEQIQLLELQDLRQAAVIAGDQKSIALIDEKLVKLPELNRQMRENAVASQVNGLLNPNVTDIAAIRALRGRNGAAAAIAGTNLRQQQTGLFAELGQDNPFGAVGQLARSAAVQKARDEAEQRKKIVDDALQAGLISTRQAADARLAIERDANQKVLKSYSDLTAAQMQLGADTFGSLAEGIGELVGHQSAAYKAIFAVSKAFSIAQATINMERAISEALALPFPANIPAMASVAAEGASVLSAIGSISGFRQGGYTGDGPVDGVAGAVHFKEWVTKAEDTSGNMNTLKAMASGAKFDRDGFGGGTNIQVIHDGSTGVQVQKLSEGRVRIIARQEARDMVGDAAPLIVGAAGNQVRDRVATTSQNPRKRGTR